MSDCIEDQICGLLQRLANLESVVKPDGSISGPIIIGNTDRHLKAGTYQQTSFDPIKIQELDADGNPTGNQVDIDVRNTSMSNTPGAPALPPDNPQIQWTHYASDGVYVWDPSLQIWNKVVNPAHITINDSPGPPVVRRNVAPPTDPNVVHVHYASDAVYVWDPARALWVQSYSSQYKRLANGQYAPDASGLVTIPEVDQHDQLTGPDAKIDLSSLVNPDHPTGKRTPDSDPLVVTSSGPNSKGYMIQWIGPGGIINSQNSLFLPLVYDVPCNAIQYSQEGTIYVSGEKRTIVSDMAQLIAADKAKKPVLVCGTIAATPENLGQDEPYEVNDIQSIDFGSTGFLDASGADDIVINVPIINRSNRKIFEARPSQNSGASIRGTFGGDPVRNARWWGVESYPMKDKTMFGPDTILNSERINAAAGSGGIPFADDFIPVTVHLPSGYIPIFSPICLSLFSASMRGDNRTEAEIWVCELDSSQTAPDINDVRSPSYWPDKRYSFRFDAQNIRYKPNYGPAGNALEEVYEAVHDVSVVAGVQADKAKNEFITVNGSSLFVGGALHQVFPIQIKLPKSITPSVPAPGSNYHRFFLMHTATDPITRFGGTAGIDWDNTKYTDRNFVVVQLDPSGNFAYDESGNSYPLTYQAGDAIVAWFEVNPAGATAKEAFVGTRSVGSFVYSHPAIINNDEMFTIQSIMVGHKVYNLWAFSESKIIGKISGCSIKDFSLSIDWFTDKTLPIGGIIWWAGMKSSSIENVDVTGYKSVAIGGGGFQLKTRTATGSSYAADYAKGLAVDAKFPVVNADCSRIEIRGCRTLFPEFLSLEDGNQVKCPVNPVFAAFDSAKIINCDFFVTEGSMLVLTDGSQILDLSVFKHVVIENCEFKMISVYNDTADLDTSPGGTGNVYPSCLRIGPTSAHDAMIEVDSCDFTVVLKNPTVPTNNNYCVPFLFNNGNGSSKMGPLTAHFAFDPSNIVSPPAVPTGADIKAAVLADAVREKLSYIHLIDSATDVNIPFGFYSSSFDPSSVSPAKKFFVVTGDPSLQ